MSKLRESARGQECQVRIPDSCNFDPKTTVLAHLNSGGIGQKASDLHGAFCCSSCHDVLDGRVAATRKSQLEIKFYHLEGVIRTQKLWLEMGLISF